MKSGAIVALTIAIKMEYILKSLMLMLICQLVVVVKSFVLRSYYLVPLERLLRLGSNVCHKSDSRKWEIYQVIAMPGLQFAAIF